MSAAKTLKKARRWAVGTAIALGAGNFAVAAGAGHARMDATVSSVLCRFIALLVLGACIVGTVKLLGGNHIKPSAKLGKFSRKSAILHAVVGGALSVAWLGTLASNAWTRLAGHRGWATAGDLLTEPGKLLLPEAIAAAALVAAAAGVRFAVKSSRTGRGKGEDDPHETELETLLMPTKKQVKHLLATDPGDAANRPYIADARVKSKLFGLLPYTEWVSLHLPHAGVAIGHLGAPGSGKGAHGNMNAMCGTAGRPATIGADNHGLGFSGPQIQVSNAAELTGTPAWRLEIARASLITDALAETGEIVTPTVEQLRAIVSVYDPTGECFARPDVQPYIKGWNPLDGVTDLESANDLGRSMTSHERNSNVTNGKYFADAAARAAGVLLLAAKRDGQPMRQVSIWATELVTDQTRGLGAVELVLAKTGDPGDAEAVPRLRAMLGRLEGPERSAVWGMSRRSWTRG